MNILFIPENCHYHVWPGKTYNDILVNYQKYSKNNINIIYTNEYHNYDETKIKNMNLDLIVFFDTDTLRYAKNFDYVFNMNIPILLVHWIYFTLSYV